MKASAWAAVVQDLTLEGEAEGCSGCMVASSQRSNDVFLVALLNESTMAIRSSMVKEPACHAEGTSSNLGE